MIPFHAISCGAANLSTELYKVAQKRSVIIMLASVITLACNILRTVT